MKNRIYFFTGTGNSLNVAETIAAALPNCELTAIFKDAPSELPADYARIGFVFPDYAGGPPQMVAEFIRNMKLPEQGDTYLFAVVTFGGHEGDVIARTEKLIAAKNWTLNYGAAVWSYPNLVTAYPMIKDAGLIAKKSNCTSKKIAKKIAARQPNAVPTSKNTASKMYDRYMAQIHDTDNGFRVNDACISCGICQQCCPAKNISMHDGTPIFHHACESCMACIQHCPKRAINYADKTQRRGRYVHPEIEYKKIAQYYK